MELSIWIAALAIFEAVGCSVVRDVQEKLSLEKLRGKPHRPDSTLIRKRRFFDEDELEDVERLLGEKIGAVCPAAKHWFYSQDDDDHQVGSHRTLGHGDAVHLAIKIRRLKKAITVLCREHTTRKPTHKPTHKPRPTHRPPYRPPYRPPMSIPQAPLGVGILPEQVVRNFEIRRYVIRPLRQLFGWPVGALASALLLN